MVFYYLLKGPKFCSVNVTIPPTQTSRLHSSGYFQWKVYVDEHWGFHIQNARNCMSLHKFFKSSCGLYMYKSGVQLPGVSRACLLFHQQTESYCGMGRLPAWASWTLLDFSYFYRVNNKKRSPNFNYVFIFLLSRLQTHRETETPQKQLLYRHRSQSGNEALTINEPDLPTSSVSSIRWK